MLAETALDALVDPRRDRWCALDVLAEDGGVVVDEDAGIEQVAGVDELLDLFHHRVRLVAPLALHERGHRAAGAVLGLQRAVQLVGDENDGVLGESHEAVYLPLLGEVSSQHEVCIAGARVPVLHALARVRVTVLGEQRLESCEQSRELVQGHCHVL